jgi:hypothetical protein
LPIAPAAHKAGKWRENMFRFVPGKLSKKDCAMPKSITPDKKAHLIASEDAAPALKMKHGMRFEVRAITVVDSDLKPSKKIAARLCGGTDTCLALVEI